ncbi:hypothetical protein T440DRAFT_61353 [Plenodomus tracheiphilus IPT5]|uniref:Uncharacterized protein n=1 Tax=Plenodomus tracheiphilus IPT5 TaxID=1408161 RepID=A0A6A7BAH1_9PLEO|nr:hypothetical protein T440DRAFT_61353 [Plenodomus tracheiphilus IPT5]
MPPMTLTSALFPELCNTSARRKLSASPFYPPTCTPFRSRGLRSFSHHHLHNHRVYDIPLQRCITTGVLSSFTFLTSP